MNPFLVVNRRQLNASRPSFRFGDVAPCIWDLSRERTPGGNVRRGAAIPHENRLTEPWTGTGARRMCACRRDVRRGCRRSAREKTRKTPALGATLGRFVQMNWSSNDVFIAAISARACELVHTSWAHANDLSAEALRSPSFVGKGFSRPGALGGLGMGRAQGFDACQTQSFQSRPPKMRRAAGTFRPPDHSGAGYRTPDLSTRPPRATMALLRRLI